MTGEKIDATSPAEVDVGTAEGQRDYNTERGVINRYLGSPCCPKCEMCGRALDECDCFGGGEA